MMRSFIFALYALAMLATPASAQVWLWSQTATSNGNIDPSINWQEGMPPSVVDDSARATLAGIAKWRDDTSGLVALGGTSTAYTATTNQGNQSGGVSSLVPGFKICFSPNVVNGTPATLQVDGQAPKPLRAAPGVALTGGEMKIGTPYCATFFSSNGGEYILNDYFTAIISAGSVGTAALANGAVTYAKIQNESNATVLGNDSGGAAPPQELTLGAGLGFSGTSIIIPNGAVASAMIANGAIGTTQLANNAVTTAIINNGAVTYAKIQNVTNARLLGNDSGGAAAPAEISLGGSLLFTSSTVVDARVVISTTAISGGSSGQCLWNSSSVVTTQACARLDVADQTITGGANVTTQNLGNFSSGGPTIDCGSRPLQTLGNFGNFTITAPANDGSCMVLIQNGNTAGTVSFSGFNFGANTGDAFDTVNTHNFLVTIVRINGISTAMNKALQ